MESYTYLVSIAIIILTTKVLGDLTKKVDMPQVVGALLAGVLIGPSCLEMITETDFIASTAEIGVILLMFLAGIDTDINEIKKNSVACMVIASIGVLVPLIGGTICYYLFFEWGEFSYDALLKASFVGVILTATSVSITVEALREMGKLDGKVGNAILGAAVIDDIIGILVLTIISSLKDPSISIGTVVLKVFLYIIFILLLGLVVIRLRPKIDSYRKKQRATTYALVFCFTIAFASEFFFGVADITGAYLFGLILSKTKIKKEIAHKTGVLSYLFFSPIFFASVGLKVELSGLTMMTVIFSLVLLFVAVITKVIGCGFGAKICGFSKREALQVGVGMVSRGEVALILAQKGYAMDLLDARLFPPIVVVVIATTILTPIALKKVMAEPKPISQKAKSIEQNA